MCESSLVVLSNSSCHQSAAWCFGQAQQAVVIAALVFIRASQCCLQAVHIIRFCTCPEDTSNAHPLVGATQRQHNTGPLVGEPKKGDTQRVSPPVPSAPLPVDCPFVAQAALGPVGIRFAGSNLKHCKPSMQTCQSHGNRLGFIESMLQLTSFFRSREVASVASTYLPLLLWRFSDGLLSHISPSSHGFSTKKATSKATGGEPVDIRCRAKNLKGWLRSIRRPARCLVTIKDYP